MKITLLSSDVASQKEAFSGTGIPYMPIGLAYLASYLQENGHAVHVTDAFGRPPELVREQDGFFIQELSAAEVAGDVPRDAELIGLVLCSASLGRETPDGAVA